MPSSFGSPRSRIDQIGEERARLVERRLAVAGDAHLVALQAQRALEHLGDLLVVLDDEHAGIASDTVHRTGQGRGAMNAA